MKYAAHPLHRKLLCVSPDKPINHFGFFEKMATAFFKISLSSVTMANSRFNRRFSSSSGVSL